MNTEKNKVKIVLQNLNKSGGFAETYNYHTISAFYFTTNAQNFSRLQITLEKQLKNLPEYVSEARRKHWIRYFVGQTP